MNDATPLYLIQAEIDQRDFERAHLQRSGRRGFDIGYALHQHLASLWGEEGPKPFTWRAEGSRLHVLGYAARTEAELREAAAMQGEPLILRSMKCIHSKAVDAAWWTPGRRLGFEARFCPTIRTTHEGGSAVEYDAFLRACQLAGKDPDGKPVPVDREQVYRDWLGDAFERSGGAKLAPGSRMSRFQLTRLLRRTQGEERQARSVQRPDVTFQGELEIADSTAFQALLRRGIGRHRSFGFGMLLVRPR